MKRTIISCALFGLALLFVSSFQSSALRADTLFQEGVPDLGDVKKQTHPDFVALSRLLSPGVVNISVETNEEEEVDEKNPLAQRPYRSVGSGFILREDGYILTNFHVIEKSSKIKVRLLDDRREYEGEVVGIDDKTDLALVKIEPEKKLQPLLIGDSDKLEVGEWVLAIGNQFQLGQTVTAGIVSAKSRRVPGAASGPYDQFIQTDASINPGSSGGPLLNGKGQVVGINTAIFSPGRSRLGGTGFNIGIGFAIPINLAKGIVEQLFTKGKVTRGLLGVIIQPVTADTAKALGLAEAKGALVGDVIPNSPAGKAGFQIRDVITAYDGHQIEEFEELPLLVANTEVGTKVTVDLLRDGKAMQLFPVIKELTAEATRVDTAPEEEPDELGLVVEDIGPVIAKSLGLKSADGVLVRSVAPDSLAAQTGLAAGDVLQELALVKIKNRAHYEQAKEKVLEKRGVFLVLVRRREGTRFLTLKVE